MENLDFPSWWLPSAFAANLPKRYLGCQRRPHICICDKVFSVPLTFFLSVHSLLRSRDREEKTTDIYEGHSTSCCLSQQSVTRHLLLNFGSSSHRPHSNTRSKMYKQQKGMSRDKQTYTHNKNSFQTVFPKVGNLSKNI